MAATTPTKPAVQEDTPTKTRRLRRGRGRSSTPRKRLLFDTPPKKGSEQAEQEEGECPESPLCDSGEDTDLFKGQFARKNSSSLPEKRQALCRPSSRSLNKSRREAKTPEPASEAATPAPSEPGPGSSKEVPAGEAPVAEVPAVASPDACIDPRVLLSLPASLSE